MYLYLNSKFQVSSHLLLCGCTALLVSDLVGNPEDRFSRDESQISKYVSTVIKTINYNKSILSSSICVSRYGIKADERAVTTPLQLTSITKILMIDLRLV